MKTRLFLFVVVACSFAITAYSQHSLYDRSRSSDLGQAKQLYEKNDFIAAAELFGAIAGQSEAGSEIHSEALFYQALCALKSKTGNGERAMQLYIDRNPESPYLNNAWYELGNARFSNNQYEQMLKAYEKVNPSGLSREDQVKIIYQKGYALFCQEKYNEAASEFERIKDSRTKMAAPAKYYWAHIQYLNKQYDEALKTFDQLKGNAAFGPVVPYYISHIYYQQSRYREVIELTEPLIRTADEQQKPALSKILGSSYFQLDQFAEAIPHLESWFNKTQSRERDENYMLGYCYYITGRFQEAIVSLEYASKGNDLLAQNALYHLAGCYIKTGDKNKARVAFEAASNMNFSPEIKEDALFNFAKITYELSYSPFNETINAFDQYISLYPNSGRNAAAYDYLVKVYMSTNNFKDAVASIERIQVKSAAIRKAWQRVTFYYGLELFNNLNYSAAAENFSKSIENGMYDSKIQAGAIFWKAESMYHLGNYRLAISGFNQFLNLPAARSLAEYRLLNYNLGYALFQVKEYDEAIASFEKYIASGQNQAGDKLGDAYNRLADCYFIKRDYRNAVNNYEQAYRLNVYEPDYALYQKAICQGLQQEQEQKINSLQSLLQTFAESDLADDACYELGRTYERINQPEKAIDYYNEMLSKYPQSTYQSKALLQLGLVYYNLSDFNRSLEYYKNVTEQFPNSPEAKSAMLGIKNNYVELNNLDAYFAYLRESGTEEQVSASEQDSLSYLSAEKLVMGGDPKARTYLERYLQQFPGGSFSLNARFYLAENKYSSGEYSSALADYEAVLSSKDHIFTEPALVRAAELQYNAGAYEKALSHYERLKQISNTKWNLLKARSGIMRCQFDLGNYAASMEAARILLGSENLPDVLKRDATFRLAKSLYFENNRDQALPLFKELASDTKSAEGAESKYLAAEILVSQNKLKEAENEVMDFISKNTPFQFWLAKSFILLSDIYLRQNDEFQAKHTLQSIVENYPHDQDGIKETAKQKLKNLEEPENQQQQKQKAPVQIDINQQ
ncbi:MAG: tetratricopeptide repeat protein [Mangrovibacterium sp.]